ncbi:MAG: hypothetical protein ACJAYY_000214 [Paraglaciecola sp.]
MHSNEAERSKFLNAVFVFIKEKSDVGIALESGIKDTLPNSSNKKN